MGTDYALACRDCLEFLDLHKWSIIEEVGHCFNATGNQSFSSQLFQLQRFPSLSNQLIITVTARQLADALKNFVPPQPYIKELVPFVNKFTESHGNHFLFLVCDHGERPWDFGEPRCFEWKEVQAVFDYDSQFLPKNLIQDFGFHHWEEVLEYYSQHQAWFLHPQMGDELKALRQAFEQGASTI